MQSYSIIALSLISAFLGVQATPPQINRRSYGPTPSYLHEVPKATQPAYHPKPQHTVYTPKPKVYQQSKVYISKPKAYYQPEVYAPQHEIYQSKQEVYIPKQEVYTPQQLYIPKKETYQPEPEVYHPRPTKPSYSPKPYVIEKPTYAKAYTNGY